MAFDLRPAENDATASCVVRYNDFSLTFPDANSSMNAAGSDDPLAMLRACHERIRKELATLDRLRLHLPENGCDADARTMAGVSSQPMRRPP